LEWRERRKAIEDAFIHNVHDDDDDDDGIERNTGIITI